MAPPSSSKPAPLPLAPDHAALSNRISLLISQRSSLLKTLLPNRAASTTTATSRNRSLRRDGNYEGDDDDSDLFQGARANEGVGYVSEKAATGGSRDDKVLRGRLMGKQNAGAAGVGTRRWAATRAASVSDDEEGRSGLGKKRKPRREPPPADAEADVVASEDQQGAMDGVVTTQEEQTASSSRKLAGDEVQSNATQSKAKKRKRDDQPDEDIPVENAAKANGSEGVNDAQLAIDSSKPKNRKKKKKKKQKIEVSAV